MSLGSLSNNVEAKEEAATRGCVLLTGAHGFTGVYVRAELEAAGYRVVGAVIDALSGSSEINLDIANIDDCRRAMEQVRPDYLVHLAAISFVQHEDAEAFYRVNVVGTLNLLQALADAKVTPRRVLIASSANVYGNAAGIVSESQVPQPVNHYAASKLAMEHMVQTWCERLPIVMTRPFNYTGVGQQQHFLAPKIVSHFKRRAQTIELGNVDVERDFSDVRFVASVYRRLLECDSAGQKVNICSGRPYSLKKILAVIQEIAGYEIEVRINPAFVRHAEVKTLVGSTDKLHDLIGEAYPAYPFLDTLRWMMDA